MPQERSFDLERAHTAYEAVQPMLAALAPADVARVTLDLRHAAVRTLKLAELTSAPELRARFAELPATAFDLGHLDQLANLGWAAWYIHTQGLTHSAPTSNARLPADLVARSYDLRARLLKLVDYHLADHPTAGPEVASIRAGTGYFDLASDLHRLAALCEAHKDAIEGDPRNYRPEDAHDAQEASIAIIQTLAEGQTPEALTAATQQAHIFTLLRNAYDDVLTTARWLLRHEPHRLGDFQSLHFNPAPRRRGAAAATVEPEPA